MLESEELINPQNTGCEAHDGGQFGGDGVSVDEFDSSQSVTSFADLDLAPARDHVANPVSSFAVGENDER